MHVVHAPQWGALEGEPDAGDALNPACLLVAGTCTELWDVDLDRKVVAGDGGVAHAGAWADVLLQGLDSLVVRDVNLPCGVLAKADRQEQGIWGRAFTLQQISTSPVFRDGVFEY